MLIEQNTDCFETMTEFNDSIHLIESVFMCCFQCFPVNASAEDPSVPLPATCFVVKSSASSEEEDDLVCDDVYLDRIHKDVSVR